jgi:thiamine-phosphate pyrophosphorylase
VDSSPHIGRLHVLTDFYLQQRFTHAELARMAIEGGADTIQFRQKRSPIRARLHDAFEVASICHNWGVPLIIDDSLDIALAVGAQGVHLGRSDLPVSVARQILGQKFLIGATASNIPEARKAVQSGADYIGFGPVHGTLSKGKSLTGLGLEALREVCAAVDIPVIAIGGVNPARIGPILCNGAHGVAVLGSVNLSQDPVDASRRLWEAISENDLD